MQVLGSIFDPDNQTMRLHDPHVAIEMAKTQFGEWQRLIQETGYDGNPDIKFLPPSVARHRSPAGRKPWWKLW
jgi:hypothetical protein